MVLTPDSAAFSFDACFEVGGLPFKHVSSEISSYKAMIGTSPDLNIFSLPVRWVFEPIG